MSSQFGGGGGRHLDATSGREVVYCHACEHEWYRDEHGGSLECPRCHAEVSEIVDPQNDPRPMGDENSGEDADPEEDDIDQLQTGFYARRNIFRGPDRFPPSPFGQQPQRTNPGDGADIMRSFTDLLGEIGGPNYAPFGGQQSRQQARGPRHITYQRISGPNFTGGISSITITGPGSGNDNREPGSLADGDAEFQRVFGDIFRGPPLDRDGHDGDNMTGNAGNPNRPLDLATALNQLFANLLNPHGTYGDGVYTQEALDRIITNLMDANPSSNAAAPASAEAIESLVRKPLDEETLGQEHKGECTICIEDMNLGDMATFLPCKHWFHEECVVLWLKEHATCPICRAAIGGATAGQTQQASPSPPEQSSSGPSSTHQTQHQMPQGYGAPSVPPEWTRPSWSQSASNDNASGPFGDGPYTSAAERRRANLREHGSARLDALRDIGQRDREQERLDRPSASRSATGGSSNSYTRGGGSGGSGNSSSGGGGGGGPFSWIRDQFRDRRS